MENYLPFMKMTHAGVIIYTPRKKGKIRKAMNDSYTVFFALYDTPRFRGGEQEKKYSAPNGVLIFYIYETEKLLIH